MAEIVIGIATDIGVKALEEAFGHLSSIAKQEISRVRSLEDNVEILRKSLPVMKGFMLNAEAMILNNKEMSSESSLTELFVKALKQFIYDGEDIVDEFEIDVRRGHMNIIRKWKIARKMKKLYNRFEDLKEKKQRADQFLKGVKNELQVQGDEVGSRLPLLRRRPSINMIQRKDFKMMGRDEDKEWLLHDLVENKLKPSVLLLTGMGGIGKTTLAHDILQDPQIASHFAFRKWITVGDQNLDPKKVLNQILDETVDTLNKATEKVQSTLEGKMFMIVLDDVWEAEDLKDRWNELWAPLSYGSEGSRVLVTTREEQVQWSMQAIPVKAKRLDSLSDEECLKIFESFAFPNGFDIPSSSSSPPPPPIHLREIGKKIVNEKVKGVPLAARVIGSSLSGKPDSYWNAALDQIKENDINSAILWSYLNLSMHMKQCFVYCSLFPKDTLLSKTQIVGLWMAQSFVVESNTQHNGGMTLVDIGERYFDVLVNASLLQVVEDGYESHGYVMHDLIHDFALNILGDEFSKGKDFTKSLRHLIIEKNHEALPQNHSDVKNLHTFMSEDPLHVDNFTRDQLKTVKYLWITDKYSDVSKTFITKLFQNLSQVRYLDISAIEISTLPTSVCNMCALQTLILNDDTIQFPKNMSKKLVELHHIEARDNVSRISRLGQLKKLHSIGGRFILHEDNGHCIEELKNLKQLRGSLHIGGLCHVQCSQLVCKEHILENHSHLEELTFDMDGVMASQVLNYLQPYENLKALKIKNYMMVQLPTWLGNEKFNIVSLELSHCSVKKLPPLGCLPQLENLNLIKFDRIEQIGENFYGRGIYVVFPSLKKVVLNGMYMLQEWKELSAISSDKSSINYFPSLKELDIYDCNSLQLPKELPSSLKHLKIDSCITLQALPKELPFSLEYLTINYCSSFQALPKELPPSLENLDICYCNNLQALPKELPSSLKGLKISGCNNLRTLPKELPSLLKYLEIESCNNLQALPKKLPSSLKYLKIQSCNNLQVLSKELPSSLEHLWIDLCPALPFPPKSFSKSHANLESVFLGRFGRGPFGRGRFGRGRFGRVPFGGSLSWSFLRRS